jgi:hypothetical protein
MSILHPKSARESLAAQIGKLTIPERNRLYIDFIEASKMLEELVGSQAT